ncbi:MAG: ABC transporter substrate-binding protein [Proteobacteria bacterium]|nr:ABC transporter substrate-binding protein [Pseudomonadota bacterium]MBI3495986.1 ABC transporter substrate-binding protein [Pseudomonadota bacterium]
MTFMRLSGRAMLLASAAASALVAGDAVAQQFTCPKKGGELVFAQEAKVNSLDQHTSASVSTRNITLNMYESLITRDENFNPIPELAASIDASQDGKTYVFKLRQGIKFHNGKPMTSADVVATFGRYKQFGIERGILDVVERWEAPDASTFILHMKAPQPTFLENLSSFLVPIVIVPAENAKAPAMQLEPVGTGPWQFVEFVADSHVAVKRFDGYTPDARSKDLDGFGGYKVACLDSVKFRIVSEPGARVAGLETGELHGVEDVPTKAVDRLKQNKDIVLKQLKNYWIQLAEVNTAAAPTDNLKFRQAAQAALDMDEIMQAATDDSYQLNIGLQYPGQAAYTEAGKETYNQKNAAKAKKLLAESGYKGEEMILLTNKDYTSMYNAALVMAEQLKAVGINAKLLVVDWPAATAMFEKSNTGWNFYFDAFANNPLIGPISSVRKFATPQNMYKPKTPDDIDKVFNAAFDEMINGTTPEIRKAAFAKAQARLLEQVYVVPFGSMTKAQAFRANVQNFRSYRIPRMSNVYFSG